MNNPAFALPATDLPLASLHGNARASRALLLSLVAHALVLGVIAALEVRMPSVSAPVHTLQISMSHSAPGAPAVGDEPSAPASAAEPEPSTQDDAREQATVSQPAVVAEQPEPAAATRQQSTSAQQGIAPAVDGMDVMFFEYVRENYELDLNRWLRERGTVYPPEAREQGLEGNAMAVFSLDREGRILSLRIGKSSGTPLLDEAALETIRRAAPFPPPPPGLPFAVIEEIYLPVRFRLETN